MLSRHLFISFVFIICSFAFSQITLATSDTERLQLLMEASFNQMQQENPEFATMVGKTHAYDDRWSDRSEKGIQHQEEWVRSSLNQLDLIDRSNLSPADQINYDLIARSCQDIIDELSQKMYFLAIDQLNGVPAGVEHTLQAMPLDTLEDYHNFLSRLEKLPTLIDQTIKLLQKGIEKGITQPKVVLRDVPAAIEKMMPSAIEESIFFHPFTCFPNDFTPLAQEVLVDKAVLAINRDVYPAYRKLHDFLVLTYIPACRTSIGACDLPNGKAWYEHCVKSHTTTSLTPQEIHELGLAEVARIQHEIDQVIQDSGFQGSRKDYFHYLHTAPEFNNHSTDGILEGYRTICHYIEKQLPLLFGKLPSLPYQVVAAPAYSESSQIGAYYIPGSMATGRPGLFVVNTFDAPSHKTWEMENLALHEALPGHHFHLSLVQEMDNVPEFRKYASYTAYIEGWGLYSECLGSELGLYRTPALKVGRLLGEIWRAVRLVVDTGIHSKGWSREQAITYFMEQTGTNERAVINEVDRYIVIPGQALAYKIGELSIKKWRREAQEAFGDHFDIRDFHDFLLQTGVLPLDLCEQQIHAWIKQKS